MTELFLDRSDAPTTHTSATEAVTDLRNLMGETINFFVDGEVRVFAPSAPAAHVWYRHAPTSESFEFLPGLKTRIIRTSVDHVERVDDPDEGVAYIVPVVAAQALSRPDVFTPAFPLFDNHKRIIGTQALRTFDPQLKVVIEPCDEDNDAPSLRDVTTGVVLKNLIPHPVTLVVEGRVVTLPSPKTFARIVFQERRSSRRIEVAPGFAVPVVERFAASITGLPEQREGVAYLTSSMVAAIVDRTDIFAPGEPIRDINNKVVGVQSLKRLR